MMSRSLTLCSRMSFGSLPSERIEQSHSVALAGFVPNLTSNTLDQAEMTLALPTGVEPVFPD